MGSLTKVIIGKEDLSIQTNTAAAETFSRLSSTGGTLSLTKIPDIWGGTGKINVSEETTNGRMYHYYATPVYDLSANVLSVIDFYKAESQTIPSGKQYDLIRMDSDTITGDNSASQQFKGLAFYFTTKDVTDSYGVIGLMTNIGAGGTKSIYGRAQASTGATAAAIAMGLVSGVTVDAGVAINTACGVQISRDGTGTATQDWGIWLCTGDASNNLQTGLLSKSTLGYSDSFIKGYYSNAQTGDAFTWREGATGFDLFRVDYLGNVYMGGADATQRAIYFDNGTRTYALQAVTAGDYLRILIESVGNGLILDVYKNLGIGGLNSFGGGQGGCVCIPNATANPASDPVGGGVLYCSAGTLYFRTSAGNIRTVAAV